MKQAALMCGALFLGACGGTADEETVAASSDSIIGATAASAYPETGVLDIDTTTTGSWACSATLIAPKVVLTAGHCVDGHKTWVFRSGADTRTASKALTYDWNESGTNRINPAHHDIGLVFLDTALQRASYPTIAKTKLADNARVVNVGRVKDGTLTSTLWAAESRVTDGVLAGYPFDYLSSLVVQPGDSGGPDFAVGTHTIVAVNSGAGSTIEVLARTDLLYDWIQQQIASHADAPACDTEIEPNDGASTARQLGTRPTCGKLASASDQDWYWTTYGPGSVTVDLTGDGGALLAVGQLVGSTCVPSLAGLRSVSLTSPGVQSICLRVTGSKAQSYTITRR